MSNRSDQVFGVSLAEIAFILIFILMLLLGFMFLYEQAERMKLQDTLARQGQVKEDTKAAEILNEARKLIEDIARRSGIPDPPAFVEQLVGAGRREAQNLQLRQELLDMRKRMESLESVRQTIEKVSRVYDKNVGDIARDLVEHALQIVSAIDLTSAEDSKNTTADKIGQPSGMKKSVDTSAVSRDTVSDLALVRNALETTRAIRESAKSELGRNILPGEEEDFARTLVSIAAKNASGLDKTREMKLQEDNVRLTEQIVFFQNRMRGLGHPPCWVKNGQAEFIFSVRTTAAGVLISPAWVPQREQDAFSIPGFEVVRQFFHKPVLLSDFRSLAQPFLDFGKRQTPECRHYVELSSSINNADDRDYARRSVEQFFYKYEPPKPRGP